MLSLQTGLRDAVNGSQEAAGQQQSAPGTACWMTAQIETSRVEDPGHIADDWLLEFHILTTYEVISRWGSTCYSANSWRPFSAATVGDKASGTMTRYPIQSHYAVTEPTSPCPNLIMPRSWPGSDKNQRLRHWFVSTRVRIPWSTKTGDGVQLIRPPRLVLM